MTSAQRPRRAFPRHLAGAAAAVAAVAGFAPPAPAAALVKVRDRGALIVGVYEDMPPAHQGGKGIDVDIAQALADTAGVRLSLPPFHADENMNDDLRNMVWRGHYLGHGPADVLMHVPVDRALMDATPRAAPNYREQLTTR